MARRSRPVRGADIFFALATTFAMVGASLAAAGSASAQEANESVGAKRDWSIFQQGAAADRQCWIVSQPLTKTAKRGGDTVSVNRGDVFLMVSIRPGAQIRNEVSMIAGYPLRDGSSVEVRIGSDTFEMFTSGEGAWTDSPEADTELVDAMQGGANAVLTGLSSRGTTTVDTFSLYGFTAALEEARALCN